jgi:hypothetical protein
MKFANFLMIHPQIGDTKFLRQSRFKVEIVEKSLPSQMKSKIPQTRQSF